MRVRLRFGSSASLAVFVQRILFQQRHQRRERMAGDVKAEQFLFVREQFVLRPFRQIGDGFRHRRRFFFQRAEERALPFLLVGQNARRARQRALDLREQASRASGRSNRTRRF